MPSTKRSRTKAKGTQSASAGTVDIVIRNRVYAVDVHPNDLENETRLARFFAAHVCGNCGMNKGSTSMPCPYCESNPVKPKAVLKPQAKNWKEVKVKSSTIPGQYYVMECEKAGRKVIRCSCPGFTYRKYCRHKTDYEGKQ
jgi:hypothetical protein